MPQKTDEDATLPATVRAHLWLEREGRAIIGPGRARVLELVRDLGSLNRAAKTLGMSYRAAWGRVKKAEAALGRPLLVQGDGARGLKLTPLATMLLEAYVRWSGEVEAYAVARAGELFPRDAPGIAFEAGAASVGSAPGNENAPERPVGPDAGGDDSRRDEV